VGGEETGADFRDAGVRVRGLNCKIMRPSDLKLSDPDTVSEELLPEYRFDYSKARPNRFASRAASAPTTVALDPDVAAVFTSQEAVNAVLRALIQTMPREVAASKE